MIQCNCLGKLAYCQNFLDDLCILVNYYGLLTIRRRFLTIRFNYYKIVLTFYFWTAILKKEAVSNNST